MNTKSFSSIKIHNYITNDSIKKAFKLHNEIQRRDMTLFSRIFNSFFNKNLVTLIEDGTYKNKEGKDKKKYKKIYTDTKTYILAYELDEDFKAYVEWFKEHSLVYCKQMETKNNCLIPDEFNEELDE